MVTINITQRKSLFLAFALILAVFFISGCSQSENEADSCLMYMSQTSLDPSVRHQAYDFPIECPSTLGKVDGHTYTFYSEYDGSYWSSDRFLIFDIDLFNGEPNTLEGWPTDLTGKRVTNTDSEGNLVADDGTVILPNNPEIARQLPLIKEWNEKVITK